MTGSSLWQDGLEDRAAPPRRNGELVFDAPWESRAFGMAMVLHEEGTYAWSEFSALLAKKIAADGTPVRDARVLPVMPGVDTAYYRCWLASLEALLIDRGLVSAEELNERTAQFAAGLWDDH